MGGTGAAGLKYEKQIDQLIFFYMSINQYDQLKDKNRAIMKTPRLEKRNCCVYEKKQSLVFEPSNQKW